MSGYAKVRHAIEQEWGHLTDAEIDKLILSVCRYCSRWSIFRRHLCWQNCWLSHSWANDFRVGGDRQRIRSALGGEKNHYHSSSLAGTGAHQRKSQQKKLTYYATYDNIYTITTFN